MNLTVLAASGRTGLAVTRQALERGRTVTAIARDPERITLPESAGLRTVAGEVTDPASIAAVIDADSVVLSALGTDRAGFSSPEPRPVSPGRRTVGLDAAPPFDLGAKVSREYVAAAMLDEAEAPRFPGTVALPLAG